MSKEMDAIPEFALVDGDSPAITEGVGSGMVEVVARALARTAARRLDVRDNGFFYKKWPGGVDEYVGANWLDYESDARAAIEAMREPTVRMVQAGWAVNGYRGDMTSAEWSAMIDAALAEGER